MPARRSYRFGDYTLDLRRGSLLKGQVEVRLRPKSFAVLQALVERHGELVTKEELLGAVWGKTVVTEGAITQCLIDVRRALGDEAQEVVRTVPRRGYVFALPVIEAGDEPAADAGQAAPASPAGPELKPTRRIAALAGATLLVTLVAAIGWNIAARDEAAGGVGPARAGDAVDARPSIAVLPFANLTADPRGEYFSDGIAEEILHVLAQSDGLRVIARTSSFAFRDQAVSIGDIADKLGVQYVIEGSVRRSGQHLRITAQLIDARDSSHVWSKAYERDARDLLAVQRDIAEQIATALEASLASLPRSASRAVAPEAHDAFLRARFFFHRRLPGDLVRSQQAYEEALRIDPGFARAWAGLAGVHGALIGEEGADTDELLRNRKEAIERALALDPGLAEARIRAAGHYAETGDVVRAEAEASIAYDLAPEDPAVLNWFSRALALQGRLDEAIALERRLVAADPLSRVTRGNFAFTLLAAGRLDEARAEFLRSVEIAPETAPDVEVDLVRILLLEGKHAEALAQAERWPGGPDRDFVLALANLELRRDTDADAAAARLRAGTGPAEAVRLAELHAHRGEHDRAFEWIGTAYDRLGQNAWLTGNWQWIYHLRFSPFLRSLHADARWPGTVRRGEPAATCAQEPCTAR
ncbi:MAG TPA: winged helix-turn-helix domain-containing protein [Steroidobacteraceae bacterium]|nr:winged helix-turn-helix domain-containing protein [Steroidobacteraceae bacterium]